MDDKRRIREEKRELKRQGNKRKRRFLKDLEADEKEFDYKKFKTKDFDGR